MYKGIPVMLSATLLSLPVSIAQGITELRNGDVADADVINQNFSENNDAIDSLAGRLDPLEQKIQGLSHPDGDLELRVTDEFSYSAVTGPSLYEKPTESITLDVGGSLGDLFSKVTLLQQ